MKLTITAGATFVDLNPSYRPQWQGKVLPAIQTVNNILKDFIAKQTAGIQFTYQDVIDAVSANMKDIRAVIASWGIKVGWNWSEEGGVVWQQS
jgi:hypothetical protein